MSELQKEILNMNPLSQISSMPMDIRDNEGERHQIHRTNRTDSSVFPDPAEIQPHQPVPPVRMLFYKMEQDGPLFYFKLQNGIRMQKSVMAQLRYPS